MISPPDPAEWPFLHPLVPEIPPGPVVIQVAGIHEAFVNRQTANTRLVTTDPRYLLQTWLHAIGERDDVRLVLTGDRDALAAYAPEVLANRGPWSDPRVSLAAMESGSFSVRTLPEKDDDSVALLRQAFRTANPSERLGLCVEALNIARTAPALLAAASTCMEVNDLEGAERDLDEAIVGAPEWAAAHFERGKLWLRRDDMRRASESFQLAATLMPGFTSAWSNLGATLGELDRPRGALAAFETALGQEPANPQALNNVGVVRRELGRLDESESAFRRVIELEPGLAFGYYNLGHTLFLQGRYQAALSAYVEGQRRDAERNPVQATRLALCRLATGDPPGAVNELRQATSGLPREYKRQLLNDTQTIAWALLTHRPDLPGWHQVNEWLSAESARLM